MAVTKKSQVYAVVFCGLLCLLLLAELSEGKKDNNNNKNNNNKNKNKARSGKQRQRKQARAPRCKDKTTFIMKVKDLKRKPFNIKCPNGPVVATDVLALKDHCQGTTGYTRWNAGRCVWNKTCSITFKDQGIDSLAPTVTDKSCLAQIPDTLQIGYTCLRKKVMVTDTLGSFKKTRKRWGVIRSHRLFPWSYRNGNELGNVTFLRPRKPAGLSTLWISVHYFSILYSDIVFLSWDEQAPNGNQRIRALRQILFNDTTISLPGVSSVILTFYADYRQHPSSIGGDEKGFVFCYQWLKPNGKPKKGSACNQVMMPGKCRKKRGSRKRKAGAPRARANKRSRNSKGMRRREKKRKNQRARNSK